MLKNIFLLNVFAFVSFTAVAASMPKVDAVSPALSAETRADESERAELIRSGYYCDARTSCYSGRAISCSATGAQVRCDAVTGSYVYCQGWGPYGEYVYAYDACP